MTALSRGENRPLAGGGIAISVTAPAAVDVSALLLGGDGKVRGDADFVFFNNPVAPGVTLHHGQGRGHVVRVDFAAVPADVVTIAVAASLDGSGPATFGQVGRLAITAGPFTFDVDGLSSESAVVGVEVYRRGGGWKVRAVGQGRDDGLAGVAAAHGVDLLAAPAPQAREAPPPQAPPRPAPPPPAPSRPEERSRCTVTCSTRSTLR